MKLEHYLLPRTGHIDLNQYDPADTGHFKNKDDLVEEADKLKKNLSDLQDRLFAERKQSLLVILQGMDCSGKDGVIKHVFAQGNPQGYHITSFKKPTQEETSHDFLWRVHKAAPEQGSIAIFNRSHYEDVLVPKVHSTLTKKEIEQRLKHIRHFEAMLLDSGTKIVKIFLHISKQFQIDKISERLQDRRKNWKFDPGDLRERHHWDAYQQAYEQVFEQSQSKLAPWYLVPSNYRWFRNHLVLQIVVDALEDLRPEYPDLDTVEERLNLLQTSVSEIETPAE